MKYAYESFLEKGIGVQSLIQIKKKKRFIKILQLLSERCILTPPVLFYKSPLPGYMECYDI